MPDKFIVPQTSRRDFNLDHYPAQIVIVLAD
jgi:hypothetical protein